MSIYMVITEQNLEGFLVLDDGKLLEVEGGFRMSKELARELRRALKYNIKNRLKVKIGEL